MAIKEAQARVTPDVSPCPHCGHPSTRVLSRLSAKGRLWVAYCPVCRKIQEHAAIPEWFLLGLPPPTCSETLH